MAVHHGGRGPGHLSRMTVLGEFAGGGEPDPPEGGEGEPIGLLLILTKAA